VGSDIRIITEPSVYLVGRQSIDEAAMAAFLADHGVTRWTTDTLVGAERLVEAAGRVAYMSFAKPRPGGNKAYIDHLLESGHGSVLEAAVFNLIITGVSRSLSHELVRHRVGFGYSQLSQRFVDESGCAFVVPPALAVEVAEARALADRGTFPVGALTGGAEAGMRWLILMRLVQEFYADTVDYLLGRDQADSGVGQDKTAARKAAREAARSVLPNETKIFVTANARALRHFIELRAHPAADAEIRRLAVAVWAVLRDAAPALFSDYQLTDLPDGSQSLSTPHRKV
jgi:thymidylate synthase (FAD)